MSDPCEQLVGSETQSSRTLLCSATQDYPVGVGRLCRQTSSSRSSFGPWRRLGIGLVGLAFGLCKGAGKALMDAGHADIVV